MTTTFSNPEALYRAQCRRNGHEPSRFGSLHERTRDKYQSAAVSCRGPVLESWHGDHTDLVHVLWDHDIKGSDADALASAIQSSVYNDARRAHDQVAVLDRLQKFLDAGVDVTEALPLLKSALIGEHR